MASNSSPLGDPSPGKPILPSSPAEMTPITASSDDRASTDSLDSALASFQQAYTRSSAAEESALDPSEHITTPNVIDDASLEQQRKERTIVIALEYLIIHLSWPSVLSEFKAQLADVRYEVNKDVGDPRNTLTMQRWFQAITSWLDDRYSVVAQFEIDLRAANGTSNPTLVATLRDEIISTYTTALKILPAFREAMHEVRRECNLEHEGTKLANKELKTQLSTHTTEISNLKAALDFQSDQTFRAQNELKHLNTTISSLESRNSDLATNYAKAARDEDIRENYINAIQDELEKLKTVEEESTKLATRAVDEKKSLASELNLLRDEYDTYQIKYSVHASESSSTKIASLLAGIRKQDKEIVGLENQINGLRVEAAGAANKLKTAQAEVHRERQRAESHAEAFGHLQSDVRSLVGDIQNETLRVVARGGPSDAEKTREEDEDEEGYERDMGLRDGGGESEEDEQHLNGFGRSTWGMAAEDEEAEGEAGPSTRRVDKGKGVKKADKGKGREQEEVQTVTDKQVQTEKEEDDVATLVRERNFYKEFADTALNMAADTAEKHKSLETRLKVQKIAQGFFWVGALVFFLAAAFYFNELSLWKGVNGTPEDRMRIQLGYGGYY